MNSNLIKHDLFSGQTPRLLLLLLLFFPFSGFTQCDRQVDSLVLVDLYNLTEGKNWTNTWNLNQPMDTWYGLTLNSKGCVQCLDLDGLVNCSGAFYNDLGNNLFGQIPESIGDLSEITFLSFGNNFLNGSIPASFGQLENLENLILRYNSLTRTIPPELGNLQKLNNLNLTSNALSGQIPEEIGFMDYLSHLFLFNNDLTGEIPASFENLQLIAFGAANNHLTGEIPSFLADIIWSRVELQNNELSGCFPDELRTVCGENFNFSDNIALPWLGDFDQFCNSSIQVGAPCDDGDPNTINSIDPNCDCVVVSTSLTEIKENPITVIPNPVKEELTIENLEFNEEMVCTIYTFEGQKLNTFETYHQDVSGLAQGIYLLEVRNQTTGQRSLLKFIKQ